jgi:hypothetical protein
MCPLINHKRDSVYSGSIAEMLTKNPLLHVWDLYDAALCLGVLGIFMLIFERPNYIL